MDPKLSSSNTKTQHIPRHFPPPRCSPERCPHPTVGQQLPQACEKPQLGREEGNYMPGEQLIQTLPDPRLKSSPDRSRRCSFIFLKRFADGWKNQCPTEESGGGWSKGKKGRERKGEWKRGEGREECAGGGRGSWRGWWEGGWAGGTYSHHLPQGFGICPPHGGLRAEQGLSQLHATEPGPRGSEPPPGWRGPTPSTLQCPWRPQIAGFRGNTSQFPTQRPTVRCGG